MALGFELPGGVLDTAAQWLRTELERIPHSWVVAGIAILAGLFVIGLVRRIAWLAVMIVLAALIVGGLWIYSGQLHVQVPGGLPAERPATPHYGSDSALPEDVGLAHRR